MADHLRQSIAIAKTSAWDDAVAELPKPEELRRDHIPLLWAAVSALTQDRPSAALRLLVAIKRLDANSGRAPNALEAMWTQHPSLETLDADVAPDLPVQAVSTDLPGPNPTQVWLLTPNPSLSIPPAGEPRTGKLYSLMTDVYLRHGATLSLALVVHRNPVMDGGRSADIARFLGALYALAWQTLPPVGGLPRVYNVWLDDGGPAGAEQWRNDIIVHQSGRERSDLEWVRELAHEWGHATLPGVTGFREPEAWANGDLGERLYLPWLAERGWLSAWRGNPDVRPYVQRYVDPLVAAFAACGRAPALEKDPSGHGFDYFLGEALYVARLYGRDTLLSALGTMEGNHTADFDAAVASVLRARTSWNIDAWPDSARPLPICIPQAGTYMLDGRGVTWNGRAVNGPITLPRGWTKLGWRGRLTMRRAPATAGRLNGRTVQIRAPGTHGKQ